MTTNIIISKYFKKIKEEIKWKCVSNVFTLIGKRVDIVFTITERQLILLFVKNTTDFKRRNKYVEYKYKKSNGRGV